MEQIPFTPPTVEQLNELLPAYQFTDFIAKGGMGAVYKATQTSLDRDVAIKILPKELSEDPEFRTSFKTEARAMAKLNHPNLIGIYDSGQVDDMLYIAMEFVAGKSLYHSCWNKQIDQNEVKRIVAGICEGLSHAHENGIIHRDIKPANILLTLKAEPKIGDFGLAQALGSKFQGILMGTPGYTAPEVIKHPENMDRRSDIFAVGVLLYEMLTGKIPEGASLPSQHCTCAKEFDAIYQKATHPNPAMRYADAKQIIADLNSIFSSGKPKQSLPAGYKPGAAKPTLSPSASVLKPAPIAKAPIKATGTPAPAKIPHPASKATAGAASSLDDDEDDDDSPLVVPTFKNSQSVSQWPLIRNLIIICILIVACVFAYQWKEVREKKILADQEDYNRKTKEQQMSDKRTFDQANQVKNETKKPDPQVQPTVVPPRPETQMEELKRLSFDLSRGERDEMPKNSARRGDMDYLLVKEEMTWDQALAFAESLGAHIAFPSDEGDVSYFTEMLKDDESIWLGCGKGGRDDWFTLNGKPWALDTKPKGAGKFVTLSYLGMIQSFNGEKKYPFIVAWHRDGSTPNTLEALFAITRQTLDSVNPQFPPGTTAFESRMFLPLIREMSFADAQKYATSAGAHIAALATEEEGMWLADALANFKAPAGLWLSGQFKSESWQWQTGEKWSYANWTEETDDDEQTSHLAIVPGKGWIKVNPEEKIDGVILEWSKDPAATPKESPATISGIKDANDLITKAKVFLTKAKKERDDDHSKNLKQFVWDMDIWHRSLNKNDQALWKPTYDTLKNACKDKIVTVAEYGEREGTVPEVPKAVSHIHTYCLEKQGKINSAFLAKATKLRDSYVVKIKEFGVAAKNAGQTKQLENIKTLLEETQNVETWIDTLENK